MFCDDVRVSSSGYEIPVECKTYEEPETSPQNDSDYVIPAHERQETYEDIKMGRNLPGYAELDQRKREREESQRSAYQKLVKK